LESINERTKIIQQQIPRHRAGWRACAPALPHTSLQVSSDSPSPEPESRNALGTL
jgi:hypothetical protein